MFPLLSARPKWLGIRLASVFILLLVIAFIPLAPARAGTITVDILVDENDHSCGDGDCSLRDAIETATAGDVIDFSVNGTITLNGTHLLIDKDLTIIGPGSDSLTVSGNNTSRVFIIDNTAEVEISGLTIADGEGATKGGGGIYSEGDLTLIGCVVRNNNASYGGGGIRHTYGTMIMNRCTIKDNTTYSGGVGGGIENNLGGSLTITNSTISGNYSGGGAGVWTENSYTTINYSTITNNTAFSNGGGIAIQQHGGETAAFFLQSSIIAGNLLASGSGTEDCYTDGQVFASYDYNLTGDGTGCGFTGPHDYTTADPKLHPLADNGGGTETHALMAGSPAKNIIPGSTNGCGDTFGEDQRGISRPSGAGCEIGSFEVKDVDNIGFNISSKYRWYLKTDRADGWSGVFSFSWGGVSELIPITGDWNGDGIDTAAFYKPSQWRWFLKNDFTDGWAGVSNFQWGGNVEMIPIAGDWDGDGDDTVGFYKPSTAEWYLKYDNTPGWTGYEHVVWGGAAENIPIAGDWDGDGDDTIGFFVPSANRWWLKNDLEDGWVGVSGFTFGTADPMNPVVGDWDGDGVDTVGGYVAANWRWFLKDDQVSGWSNVSILKFGVTAGYDVIVGDWQ